MTDGRTKLHLQQMQGLPLEMKIRKTQMRIREWYDYWGGTVYVSFSGGKDSTVLKHIVDSMYDDVPSVFVNTGLEYPEIQKFARAQNNVITIKPKVSFKDVITEFGYPVISKEVANCVRGARTFLDDVRGGHPKPRYPYNYRRLAGLGEYARANTSGSHDEVAVEGQSDQEGYP